MPLLRDRSGRFSPLLALTLLALMAPAVWLALRAANGDFSGPALAPPFGVPPGLAPDGPSAFGGATPGAALRPGGEASARPIYDAIHLTGDWAVRFLLLSLAVTPFRRLWHWSRLQLVRRRIGLAALAYAALHLGLYAIDQELVLSRIATEIVLRIYLAVGFVALLGLIALGATSTDGMVRRMGAKRWGQLHKAAYGIAGLAVLHFAMQSKLDVGEPMLMWGLFGWAMGWRWLQARHDGREIALPWLLGLAVATGLFTAASEALWYGLATGVDPWRVLGANLDPGYGVRPAGWALAFGLAAAASSLIGVRRRGPERARASRPAPTKRLATDSPAPPAR